MGGDRELVMFSGLVAFALIFSAQELRATVFGLSCGLAHSSRAASWQSPTPKCALCTCDIGSTRAIRAIKLKGYYPPRSTHFRLNPIAKGNNTNDDSSNHYIIAGLGILMVLILYCGIHNVNAELKLKKYRSKDAGLADLLNYAAMVDDGVIVGKNGSFMAAWLYQGDDNASSTDEQREMVSFRINQAYRVSAMGG